MKTRKMVLAAMFLAIGQVLPFITGHIQQIGQMLSPMHIPVLLCGLICGPAYGALVGFICPLLRSVVFGMPAMFPAAIGMAFELCTYGLVCGFLYRGLKGKGLAGIYGSLIPAMIAGRIVWGIARMVMAGIVQTPFTMQMFLAGSLLGSIPGIVLQLILIPAIMMAVERGYASGAYRLG